MTADLRGLPFLFQPRWPLALTMLAWACVHCLLDHPYRALLWDESMMTAPLALFGMTWTDWASNAQTSAGIDAAAWYLGLVWAVCALLVCLPLPRRASQMVFAISISLALLLTWARWAGHGYDAIWPLEFALRLALPCAWLVYDTTTTSAASRHWPPVLLAACSATFIGHGCYAMGLWPTPLAFQSMLGFWWEFSPTVQTAVLHLIGLLDVLVAIGIWIPRLRRPLLLWMAIWGGATALMRCYSIDTSFLADSLLPALTAVAERLAHFSIPLLCWYLYRTQTEIDEATMPVADLDQKSANTVA